MTDRGWRATALARRRQGIGLVLLAAAILVAVLLRAEKGWVFPPGWWRF